MSPLFETIRISGRVPLHLGYHAARMNRSRRELFGMTAPIDLAGSIVIPDNLPPGIHRCRVFYGEHVDEITFTPYIRREVGSLTLVGADDISYGHKFTDRSAIERLRQGIAGDDILIVRRGLITDTSYSNIVFFDGARWVTPASPLLPGTARARLLDEWRITAEEIRVGDLGRFTRAVLVNAMIEFRKDRWIDVKDIR